MEIFILERCFFAVGAGCELFVPWVWGLPTGSNNKQN